MSVDGRAVAAHVAAAAEVVGLRIAPGHAPGVARFMALAAEMAAVVEAAPLNPDDEPTAAFRLPDPEPGR